MSLEVLEAGIRLDLKTKERTAYLVLGVPGWHPPINTPVPLEVVEQLLYQVAHTDGAPEEEEKAEEETPEDTTLVEWRTLPRNVLSDAYKQIIGNTVIADKIPLATLQQLVVGIDEVLRPSSGEHTAADINRAEDVGPGTVVSPVSFEQAASLRYVPSRTVPKTDAGYPIVKQEPKVPELITDDGIAEL